MKFALYCVFHLFSYESKLDDAAKYGIKKGFGTGVGMGCFQFVNYINYALSFW
jgi:hypothetical protein